MNRLSYRRPSLRSRIFGGARGAAIALCAIIIAILVVLRFVFPGALAALSSPLWRAGSYVTNRIEGSDTTTSRAELVRVRASLQEQNAVLSAQNAALAARVADLTTTLGTRTEPEKGIVASVLARPPVAPYDVLIIDQGADAGVTNGAQVQGAGGTPIGVVGEVEGNRSRVSLYSSKSIATDGWAGAGRIPVSIQGNGAGTFTASIAKDAGVAVGDGVYVAQSGAFPIGTITKIEEDPSSPNVALDIRPFANPFSLTWVTVLPQ